MQQSVVRNTFTCETILGSCHYFALFIAQKAKSKDLNFQSLLWLAVPKLGQEVAFRSIFLAVSIREAVGILFKALAPVSVDSHC